ncbi:toprim domain-containing protein [Streptomyces sp. BHT-5-2]|uniref:toprim domain-containing protein n=1 Tax=Streptomyces sp. BHT-5-2 TaxID=2866715 RepID=UPI0021B0E18C|nr:toprim domain-containing protein [Streptomyces sp. BHT-5-2]
MFAAHSGFGTVLITEGPGDALTAVGVGYDAVAIRGAGLARNDALVEELAKGLQDRDVVLAGDRDTAGAQFTAAPADALVRAGAMVRRLDIPHAGDDLTDWRARDPEAFPEQLHAAVRRAPLHVIDQWMRVPRKTSSASPEPPCKRAQGPSRPGGPLRMTLRGGLTADASSRSPR